jgi:CRP-like cAMP-binding protein
MIALFKYLRAIHPLSNDLRDYLEDTLKEKHLARKDFLLKAGHICQNIYFVEQGILRTYYLKGDRDISSAFPREGEICVSLESFSTQKPGAVYIQALEDCTLYYINYDEFQRMTRNFPEFNAIGRILLERCLRRSEQRMIAMWMQQGEDKFNWLAEQYPYLIQRVQARFLATYIGLTEGMLSTIKARRK